MSRTASVVRFHAKAAVPLAWRASVPLMTAMSLALGFGAKGKSLSEVLERIADVAMGASGAVVLVALSLSICVWAAPRLTYGATGWLRHLPVGDSGHRRGVQLALVVAQAPALLAWTGGWALTAVARGEWGVEPLLRGLVLAFAVSMVATPTERKGWSVGSGVAAVALAVSGGSLRLACAGLVLAMGDRLSGALTPTSSTNVGTRFGRGGVSALGITARITLRAVGRHVARSYAMSSLPMAGLALFVMNNEFEAAQASTAARLGGGVALAFFLADVAATVSVRRPPWPWSRSLPVSSSRRVLMDAAVLGMASVPMCAVVAWLSPSSAVPVVVMASYMSVRTAGWVAGYLSTNAGANGAVWLELLFVALVTAWQPWATFVWVLLMPAAVWLGARGARGANVTGWRAREHLAVGDTSSWSAG